MARELTFRIANGEVQFIHDDAAMPLVADLGGDNTITRASHVEPFGTGWAADMRPSGGPILFANGTIECDNGEAGFNMAPVEELVAGLPDGEEYRRIGFETRAEALAAERAWLQANRGL